MLRRPCSTAFLFYSMTVPTAFLTPAPGLTVQLRWSAHTAVFIQQWQQRLRTAEVPIGQPEEHMAEAATQVLHKVEHLNDYTAQVLASLYQAGRQLPAPGDRLLVEPLVLRVEERQLAASHPGGNEQVDVTYCFTIERYRYEEQQPLSQQASASKSDDRPKEFFIAPGLSLLLLWSSQMYDAFSKRYKAVMYNPLSVNESLRREYDQWEETKQAAYQQIKQFFALTGSLPVVGDTLHVLGLKPGYNGDGVYIEDRIIFSCFDSDDVQVVYHMRSDDMKGLLDGLEEDEEGMLNEGAKSQPTIPLIDAEW
jgi:hypothetical protein